MPDADFRIDFRIATGKVERHVVRAKDEYDALEVLAVTLNERGLAGTMTDVIVQKLNAGNENGCPQTGNLGFHSEDFLDDGPCVWCGAENDDEA